MIKQILFDWVCFDAGEAGDTWVKQSEIVAVQRYGPPSNKEVQVTLSNGKHVVTDGTVDDVMERLWKR